MNATLDEALTRLKIVKDATYGLTGELVSAEAFGAVHNLIEALIDTYMEDETERGRMIYVLALNAVGWSAMCSVLARDLGMDNQLTDNAFTTFAATMELLVNLHKEADS